MTEETILKTMQEHTSDLVDEYSAEITEWADAKVPPILTNREYAARTSALMISLCRQLGRAAAAFGEAQQAPSEEVSQMVVTMFLKHQGMSIEALQVRETVQ